jgi:hypothetical protein
MTTLDHRMYVCEDPSKGFSLELAKDIGYKTRFYLSTAGVQNDVPFELEPGSSMDALLRSIGRAIYDNFVLFKKPRVDIEDPCEGLVQTIVSSERLPDWFCNLSKSQTLNFLFSLFSLSYTIEYNCSHNKLFDQIQTIILHAGYIPECSVLQGYQNIVSLTMNINAYKLVPIVNQEDITILPEARVPVFCLEVPGGIFYTRRFGNGLWTGNSRSTGPVTKLTRQPLEGRSRSGGLRLGEMERDCFVAYSVSNILQDRFLYNSDIYRVHVCDICGFFAQADTELDRYLCTCTGKANYTKISQVHLPYACKLLFQELMAMNVGLRLLTE